MDNLARTLCVCVTHNTLKDMPIRMQGVKKCTLCNGKGHVYETQAVHMTLEQLEALERGQNEGQGNVGKGSNGESQGDFSPVPRHGARRSATDDKAAAV